MNYVRLLAHDAIHGLRGFLVLDAFVRLFIWAASMAFCAALFTHYGLWPSETIIGANLPTAWAWAGTLVKWIIAYNSIYVLMLIVLRLPIPTPREGRYSLKPGKIPSIQLVWSCLIATLTKARFEAPFPAFLVFHMANLPPLSWLMSMIFGPRSKSCYVTDPRIIDPHLVSVGRNVVIGINAIIAAHYQEKDAVIIKRTIIEDDVIIGASVLMSGAHIKRGATIGAGAVVLPGTVVGENEHWAGNPARRRKASQDQKATAEPLVESSYAVPDFSHPQGEQGAAIISEARPVPMA